MRPWIDSLEARRVVELGRSHREVSRCRIHWEDGGIDHLQAPLRRTRPSMGTWFEVWLVGDDHEHLDAVAAAVLDEVERIEGILSRHDPRGELSRLNREAGARDVLVSVEVFDLLLTCRALGARTGGRFDPVAGSDMRYSLSDLILDEARRTARFPSADMALDLGGIGKGYALDRASEILDAQGVGNALLHGGTSSVLARGDGPHGDGWLVGVRDPFDSSTEAARVRLKDQGFSCSAVFGQNQEVSDVIDPARGQPLNEPSACVVIAPSATMAEAFSTALLVAGRSDAERIALALGEEFAVGWIDRVEEGTRWTYWPGQGAPR